MIPSQLSDLLKNYQCDIATWELVHFAYTEQKWGTRVVLKRETDGGSVKGKAMLLEGPAKFKIETFDSTETF